MTMTHSHHHSRRRLDAAGLILLFIGLVFGALAYWLIVDRGVNPLILVPAVVAATLGAMHVSKREASRR
jgi:hypothetical protein